MNPPVWQEHFATLHRHDLLSDQDINFARFICAEQQADDGYSLFLAAALIANAVNARGYICLDLTTLSDNLYEWFADFAETGLDLPEVTYALRALTIPNEWTTALAQYQTTVTTEVDSTADFKPLVLNNNLLYLYRTWFCEVELGRIIRSRCTLDHDFSPGLIIDRIQHVSQRFAASDPALIEWQQVAVFTALRRQLSVITGGPGTGKTTVAAAIIALLLERNPAMHVKLCAPTGKAQNRLQEAIYQEIKYLNVAPEVITAMSGLRATTIHRLIGAYPDSDGSKYHPGNLLLADVLLVDEVSMVSQSLLVKLLTAVPPTAKIILLGDANQLTSVEAGMVLRELYLSAQINHASARCQDDLSQVFTKNNAALPKTTTILPLNDAVIELQLSRRFDPNYGIGLTAAAIRAIPVHPDPAAITAIIDQLSNDASQQISLLPLPTSARRQFEDKLWDKINQLEVNDDGTATTAMSYLKAGTLKDAFRIFNKFRFLCSRRSGSYGSDTVNAMIESKLLPQLDVKNGFYRGRPILIRENSPEKKLNNGDVGLTWYDDNGKLKVFFMTVDECGHEAYFAVEPYNLPLYEPAFALTIHKAQGTGFQKIILVVAPESRLLTRELLYTGITRAEMHAEIWADHNSIRSALENAAKRHSGLMTRMRSTI
jgi:exodeoxyribonuclease V alpha subunit